MRRTVAARQYVAVPVPQLSVTPLVDVLLVLLVLGLLSWTGATSHDHRAREREPALEPVPGLSLPLRPHTGESAQTRWGERTALIGLGPHGRLNWRGTPVTRGMLEQQLSQVLAQDPQADVWLAADEALPYADLLPWLEWLQAQHVVRVTLLTRSLTPAQMSGKP